MRTVNVSDIHQRIEAVVAAFARGEIVVVTDDDDRENEGDLFVAASLCRGLLRLGDRPPWLQFRLQSS